VTSSSARGEIADAGIVDSTAIDDPGADAITEALHADAIFQLKALGSRDIGSRDIDARDIDARRKHDA
jgi:hypothetical protein